MCFNLSREDGFEIILKLCGNVSFVGCSILFMLWVVQVLRLLLPELRKRGYRVVSLSELEESVSNPEVKQAD